MNKYDTAIAELRQRAGRTLKTALSEETARLAIEAMEYKAERENMRCENCNNCEQGETVYDRYCAELEKNCYTMKFCSEFKPKENEK